jgi:hypothetical protein
MSIQTSATIPVNAPNNGNKINPLLETGKGTGEDHFSFKDVLDIINPLQHIPIINTIYRKVTGDEISNFSRIAGGALYGGFIGAALGMANAVSVNETGDDMGGVAMSKLGLIKSQEDAQKEAQDNTTGKPADQDAATASTSPDTSNMPVVEIHPSDKQAANKDQIIWDQPVKTSDATPATGNAPAAMPTPKELNNISPASSSTADPSVDKADVQKNMNDALNKYNAMQSPDATNAIVANAATPNTGVPKNIFATPAGAPSADVVAAEDTPAPKQQPTAQYNKLRHYSN